MKTTDTLIIGSILVTAVTSFFVPARQAKAPTEDIYVTPMVEEVIENPFVEEKHLTLNPDLVPVCSCESIGTPNLDPFDYHYEDDGVTPLIGKINPLDRGMCQINMPAHEKTAVSMGLDILHNIDDYVYYSNWLYEQQGYTPWRYSSHCWGDAVK